MKTTLVALVTLYSHLYSHLSQAAVVEIPVESLSREAASSCSPRDQAKIEEKNRHTAGMLCRYVTHEGARGTGEYTLTPLHSERGTPENEPYCYVGPQPDQRPLLQREYQSLGPSSRNNYRREPIKIFQTVTCDLPSDPEFCPTDPFHLNSFSSNLQRVTDVQSRKRRFQDSQDDWSEASSAPSTPGSAYSSNLEVENQRPNTRPAKRFLPSTTRPVEPLDIRRLDSILSPNVVNSSVNQHALIHFLKHFRKRV